MLENQGTATLTLPRALPTQRIRAPKKNIPQTLEDRTRILQAVRTFVSEHQPVPPTPMEDLKLLADDLVDALGVDRIYRDYVGVLINNEMWRETLASVPYERRLLLLPKCLRLESKCPAPFDEFGLLCKQCGLCTIQDLQNEAEKLGYAVLVAEGSAIVMSLIQTGKIDAIVGVSCLSVLERAFPYMEAAAVPGIAIPLLQDDCIDTTVDLDWVWEYIHLTSDDQTRRLDLGALRDEVDFWFTPASLDLLMGAPDGETELIARSWLMKAGKRWRPFLTAAVHQALTGSGDALLPDDVKKVAIAVECFHKASLIHDDLEDDDAFRYGEKTLHTLYGAAMAINLGDFLIGEGYRLLGETSFTPEQKARMLQVAAQGHRKLCQGQGAELCWAMKPRPLKTVEVIDIFRRKTAPAFEVALHLGAVSAGLEIYEEVSSVLHRYSEALGIAYQIRDDLSDHGQGGDTDDVEAMRPNLPMALAYEKARSPEDSTLLEQAWTRTAEGREVFQRIETLCHETGALDRAESLMNAYKDDALRALSELTDASLKGLLRRTMGKIFNDVEIRGWCSEAIADQARPMVEEPAPPLETHP